MYWRHLFISYIKHCEKHKLPPDKERFLSLGAILIHSNEDTERVLVTSKCRPFYREGMEDGWDIVDRNSAITTINWCLEEGHSDYYKDRVQHFAEKSIDELDKREKEFFDDVEQYQIKGLTRERFIGCNDILSWDYDRAAYLARVCYNLGYLTEEETWSILKNSIAPVVKERYSDWLSYAVSYLLGRFIWGESDNYSYTLDTIKDLLSSDPEKKGIWVTYPIHSI